MKFYFQSSSIWSLPDALGKQFPEFANSMLPGISVNYHHNTSGGYQIEKSCGIA